jgi:hypothetical protein
LEFINRSSAHRPEPARLAAKPREGMLAGTESVRNYCRRLCENSANRKSGYLVALTDVCCPDGGGSHALIISAEQAWHREVYEFRRFE